MRRREIHKFLAPLFLALITGFSRVRAYTVSITADIISDNIEEGHIISSNSDTYKLSDSPYSEGITGVVNNNPEIAIFEKNNEDASYIAITGNVPVKVSGINGEIKEGDFITTSEIPGVGMKATQSGYVLGEALESFIPKNKEAQGLIAVNLDIKNVYIAPEPAKGLLKLFRRNTDTLSQGEYNSGDKTLKYILATVVLVLSFAIGISTYLKVALKGVNAIEKNPNVMEFIKSETKTNMVVTILIVFAGLIVSFVILLL